MAKLVASPAKMLKVLPPVLDKPAASAGADEVVAQDVVVQEVAVVRQLHQQQRQATMAKLAASPAKMLKVLPPVLDKPAASAGADGVVAQDVVVQEVAVVRQLVCGVFCGFGSVQF
ncbi:hypothetical protein PF003_g17641 [Phytophthora fragariae]|nr:hypothetical protein PF003_g17641 [Phytophthora fragariae]